MSLQIVYPVPEALRFTYEDYRELPEDGNKYEIINGELSMTPSPLTIHQIISHKLNLELGNFVARHDLGFVFQAPLDVILSQHDIVQPDLFFISKSRQAIVTEKNIQGAPDLVIEIISPETKKRDLGLKKKLYAKHGVKEYWVVYPKEKRIGLYALVENEFQLFATYAGQDTLRSKVLQGFELTLATIF